MTAAEVAAANERYGELMTEGNAKGMSELYTENCRVLAPGVPPVFGKVAFQKFIEGLIAGGCKGAKFTSDEIQPGADEVAEGGTIWEGGNYKLFKEGGAIMDTGKYVVIWKKVSVGKVQLDIDIWNSNGQ